MGRGNVSFEILIPRLHPSQNLTTESDRSSVPRKSITFKNSHLKSQDAATHNAICQHVFQYSPSPRHCIEHLRIAKLYSVLLFQYSKATCYAKIITE